MHSTDSVDPTGTQEIDGLLHTTQWDASQGLTYGFPDSVDDFGYSPFGYAAFGFYEFNDQQQAVAIAALDTDDGNAANDAFSIEGFTLLDISQTDGHNATLRYSNTSSSEVTTAYAYLPTTADSGGDAWFGDAGYRSPVAGNYAWHTILHETGHAMGLTHPHEDGGFGIVPKEYDMMELSVMSYRSYEGGSTDGGYTNETWGYAQTFMILDIAALQEMYGADYSVNDGDTVYTWSPDSGDTWIDGALAIDAGGDRIFMTVWDGGGTDTYDLSAYSSKLDISLKAGGSSFFSATQVAQLGDGLTAQGSVYNARLYEDNTASLIENATGGSGNDTIEGNSAKNLLIGNDGGDALYGAGGKDTLKGGKGKDILDGQKGADKLNGQNGNDDLSGGKGNDNLIGGGGNDTLDGGKGDDTLKGGSGSDRFEFALGDENDVIVDFADDQDVLVLADFGLANSTEALTFATDVGGDVMFDFGGGDVLTVQGTSTAALVDDILVT